MESIDKETIKTIYKVANKLAPRFRFGYHSREDMIQQAVLISLQCLKQNKYDDSRGSLENFLYVHVKNRLLNYRRDNFERLSKPCSNCEYYHNNNNNNNHNNHNGRCEGDNLHQCTLYYDREECKLYSGWLNRNQAKKGLMESQEFQEFQEFQELQELNEFQESKESKESQKFPSLPNLPKFLKSLDHKKIDQHLPIEFRADYIKYMANIKIPKQRFESLLGVIREILEIS